MADDRRFMRGLGRETKQGNENRKERDKRRKEWRETERKKRK